MTATTPGFKVETLLHESANCLVYRAIRVADGLPVILKALPADSLSAERSDRFQHEYELGQALNIDGVIRFHDMQFQHGRQMIVMEDIGGEALDRLAIAGALPLDEWLQLAIGIVYALEQLHRCSIIHKDVNPSNIVWNRSRRQVRLIDLGIATEAAYEVTDGKFDRLEGTLSYISPEQTGRINRAIDYRTDFYSLGVTFYELLTGQLPFTSASALEQVHAHVALTPRPVSELRPDVPVILSDIVAKLLAKTAGQRYQSAFGLRADLQTCLDSLIQHGEIASFPLGRDDVSERLQVSHTLYGRETQTAALLSAFDKAQHGRSNLLLVAGYSGIGKSALVHEIERPLHQHGGHFVSGKFDQFKRDMPYSALIQAISQLVRQLLTEEEAAVQQWRATLLKAVGNAGQVILDVIPDVALLIGAQPAVPVLQPEQAQNRFNDVFARVIGAFAAPGRPLVMFLDDLQWADLASLQLISMLMREQKELHLLLIGAYRDNEVSGAHPLALVTTDMEGAGVTMETITLEPLNLDQTAQLLGDTLRADAAHVKTLTQLCFAKTGGNPFFLNQFLTELAEHKLLWLDAGSRRWTWDIEKIEQADFTANVVELLVGKLKRLPADTQRVMQYAACLGNVFDLRMLAIICALSESDTAQRLWPAQIDQLIAPLDERDDYIDHGHDDAVGFNPVRRFLHDRIQQAAYQLSSDAEKPAMHLVIGRLLLRTIPEAEREALLFDLVNHFNLGRSLLTGHAECLQVAKLNLAAGRHAKACAAFQPALTYLQIAASLVREDDWLEHYDFMLELHTAAAEAACLCHDFAGVEHFVGVILSHVSDVVNQVPAYKLRMLAHVYEGHPEQAVYIGCDLLHLLGVPFPRKFSKARVIASFLLTGLTLLGRSMESLARMPEMTERRVLAAAEILNVVGPAAYRILPNHMAASIAVGVRLTVRFGFAKTTPMIFAAYAMFVGSVLGNFAKGAQYGKLAMQRREGAGSLETQEPYVRASAIVLQAVEPWTMPLHTVLESLRENYLELLEFGNADDSGNFSLFGCIFSFYCGRELGTLAKEVAADYRATMVRASQGQYVLMVIAQTIHELMGDASVAPFALDGNSLEALRGDSILMLEFHTTKLILSYFLLDYATAEQHIGDVAKYSAVTPGMVSVSMVCFFESLTVLARLRQDGAQPDRKVLRRVKHNQARLRRWARFAPANFLHKWYLVEAELASGTGHAVRAAECYEQAIRLARENAFLHEQALGCELAGGFYLGRGNDIVAKAYLAHALVLYRQWGALAKVRELTERFPLWLREQEGPAPTGATTSVTDASTSGLLDFSTALKASQALSQEIVLERLLAQLMDLAIENAGAQKGLLLLKRRDRWFVEAARDHGAGEVTAVRSLALDEVPPQRCALALLHYAIRTRESVVIDDACEAALVAGDPYVRQCRARSMLALPIMHQGEMNGLLYLENNAASGVFNAGRLQVLHLLAAQAAISIENAHLYTDMEQRVVARTAEVVQQKAGLEIAHRNISLLSEVGRQITQTLDPEAIVDTLYRQVQSLMDARMFALGVYREEQAVIEFPFAVRDGTRLAPCTDSMHDASLLSVWCVRHGAEIFINDATHEYSRYVEAPPPADAPRSLLYAPMRVKGRTLGLVTVQNPKPGAYDRMQMDMLTTLASYAAVALDNADAYQQLAQAMSALQDTQQQLVFQEKMASIGTLTAGVAHEINNPANFAHAGAQVLGMELERFRSFLIELAGEGNDEIVENLNQRIDVLASQIATIVEGTSRIRGLVKDLRTFSRLDEAERKAVAIGDSLESTIHLVRTQYAQSVEIRCVLAANPMLECWPAQLNQVFMNLIVNACHAIRVRQERDGDPTPRLLDIRSRLDSEQLLIDFEDEGCGMPPGVMARIFEPFYTTKGVGDGAGLGLSISFGIVEKHGGRIEVRSVEGEGSCFTVRLPLHAGASLSG